MAEKATKREAQYTPDGTRTEHCGICTHFTAPNGCNRIEGPVRSQGWCKYFNAANPTIHHHVRQRMRRQMRQPA